MRIEAPIPKKLIILSLRVKERGGGRGLIIFVGRKVLFFFKLCHCRPILAIHLLTRSLQDTQKLGFPKLRKIWGGRGLIKILWEKKPLLC